MKMFHLLYPRLFRIALNIKMLLRYRNSKYWMVKDRRLFWKEMPSFLLWAFATAPSDLLCLPHTLDRERQVKWDSTPSISSGVQEGIYAFDTSPGALEDKFKGMWCSPCCIGVEGSCIIFKYSVKWRKNKIFYFPCSHKRDFFYYISRRDKFIKQFWRHRLSCQS